jgi:hypothetical protein
LSIGLLAACLYHNGVAREGGESTWRWLIGVLLAVGAIVATLVAADKIRLPGGSPPESPPSIVDNVPRLILDPNSGKPGTTVKIRVTGFGPDELVTVRFAEVIVASPKTDGTGTAEVRVLIPSDAKGSTTVTARGDRSGRTTTAVFQVLG